MFPEKFNGKDDTTSEFILDIDRLFDSLNSRLLTKGLPNKLNYAISKDSEHKAFLEEIFQHLKHSKFQKGPKPACINGFLLTINSVLRLSDDLRNRYGIDVLKTRRLNQDPLENLFATVRQQHGCHVDPSPSQFENGIRQILITQLTKLSKTSNCELDENIIFAKLSQLQTEAPKTLSGTQSEPAILISFNNNELENNKPETKQFTEENAIYYISGYLCNKFAKLHKCQSCEQILFVDQNTTYEDYKLFTLTKEYDATNGLKHVSRAVFEDILAWEKSFQSVMKSSLHLKGISRTLTAMLEGNCQNSFQLCSPEATNAFINMFVRIRCHWEARFIRRSLNGGHTLGTTEFNKKGKQKKKKKTREK